MGHRLSLLTALSIGVAVGCAPAKAPNRPASAATSLPRAPLTTLDGNVADLRAVVRARATLVSFWATWCDACVREMDSLNRLSANTRGRPDALVVGIALGEESSAVKAFAEAHALRYVQLVDTDFRLADALGERRVPSTLVLDHDGRIVYRGGALDGAALAAFRRALGVPR